MPPSLEDYRWRIANVALAGSTLRNQGAAGVVVAAQGFAASLDLARFVTDDEEAFLRELDLQADNLRKSLPNGAQNWGTARKAINVFLEEAFYHRFVCPAFGLERIERYLEVPLDYQVADHIRRNATASGEQDFPRFPGIKYLTPTMSRRFQDFANVLANRRGEDWARIHLDAIIWRRG
jgi:hypothetical protein